MNYEYEPEINLKDLFFYILYRWRSIALAAIVLCALAGGYKLFCNTMEAREEGANGKPKETREYEIKMAEYNLAKSTYEQDIVDYQKRLDQQTTYMEESILMQANPYNMPSASADIIVKLDGEEWDSLPENVNISLDPTDSLISVYTANFLSAIDWTAIEELTGKTPLYLKELIGVTADYNANTFTIYVNYNDGDIAQQILDILLSQIMEKYQDVAGDINKHTISIVNRSLTYTINHALADTQKENANIIVGYEQSIIERRTNLEELEKPSRPKNLQKFLILGFVAGIFLMIMYHGFRYILGGRLHDGSELKGMYGLLHLGTLPAQEHKGFLSRIDKLLGMLDTANQQKNMESNCQVIAQNIINLADEHKNLFLTSTGDMETLQKLSAAIAPLLEGIHLETGTDIAHNAETLRKLSGCDAVILAEVRQKSLLSDIAHQQERINAYQKPVIGFLLL